MKKNVTLFLRSVFVLGLSVITLSGFSQVATFNAFGTTGYGGATLAPASVDGNAVVGSLTKGSGIGSSGTAAAGGWGGTGFFYADAAAALAGNAFFTLTVAPKENYSTTLSGITGSYRRSGSGAKQLSLQYSIDGGTYADVSTFSLSSTSTNGVAFTFSNVSAIPTVVYPSVLTLRFIPFDGTASGGTFYFFSNTASSIALSLNATTILPVTLKTFTASKAGSDISLAWEVENEIGFSHYEVEKSGDGASFTKLSQVAAGKSSYTFTDAAPVSGTNLYRLKLVDKDGKFTYSKVVKADISLAATLSIFPNPAKSSVSVSHPAAVAGAIIRVSSLEGKTVLQQAVTTGYLQTQLSVGQLSKGQYLVEFISAGKKTVTKLLKD